VILVALAVLLFLRAREERLAEAWLQASLLRAGGIHAERIGTAVLVDVGGRPSGIDLTTGCSIGPLLGVFLAAAAPFVWYRALSLSRLLAAVGQLTGLLVLTNQLRITAIVLSMRRWGFERGYDVSHVFLGSAITTVGFVAGVVLFVRLVAARPKVSGA
jgi:exosortase/archaeosortase family protein